MNGKESVFMQGKKMKDIKLNYTMLTLSSIPLDANCRLSQDHFSPQT